MYAAEGDWKNAGISGFGMVRIAGWAVPGGRLGSKAYKGVKRLVNGADDAGDAERGAKGAGRGAETGPRCPSSFVPGTLECRRFGGHG